MRIARYDELPWTRTIGSRGSGDYNDESLPEDKRQGGRQRTLFKGTPHTHGNFEMVVLRTVRSEAVRHYPRHHHDFDQLRMTLRGNPEWAPGIRTPQGWVIYVAAGTFYGPYDRQEGEEQLHIQFEGANRALFIDYDSLKAARDALAKKGTFERGFYTWVDEQGRRHNQDGHEANAEYASGKPVQYPTPRYSHPINLDPDAFAWSELEPGVTQKHLATFTERDARVWMLRLDGNVAFRVTSPQQTTLLFVKSGAGRANGEPIKERDGMLLEKGEAGVLATAEHLEVLLLGLPKVEEPESSDAAAPALAGAATS
jgi:hypothetical protein